MIKLYNTIIVLLCIIALLFSITFSLYTVIYFLSTKFLIENDGFQNYHILCAIGIAHSIFIDYRSYRKLITHISIATK